MNRYAFLIVVGLIAVGSLIYGVNRVSAVTSGSAAVAEPADPLAGMRVDHIMVNARDYETSFAWYRDKLDFEPVVTWTVDGLVDTDL